MNLQEIITAKVPGAVYTEAGDGMFTIPVEQFHDLARYLHDDPALRFDFLRSLTGMDWGEEGLGAVYHLESTATGENVVLKVLTPSREQCGLPTVSDIWKGAELNEREVFDFFGIGFINHPDINSIPQQLVANVSGQRLLLRPQLITSSRQPMTTFVPLARNSSIIFSRYSLSVKSSYFIDLIFGFLTSIPRLLSARRRPGQT